MDDEFTLYPSDFRNQRLVATLCAIVARDRVACGYTETAGYFAVEERSLKSLRRRRVSFEIAQTKLERAGRYLDELLQGDERHLGALEAELKKQTLNLAKDVAGKPKEELLKKRHKQRKYYESNEYLQRAFSDLFTQIHNHREETFRTLAESTRAFLRERCRIIPVPGKSKWHCHSNGTPPSPNDFPESPYETFAVVISHNYVDHPTSKEFVVYGITPEREQITLHTHDECRRCVGVVLPGKR